MTLSFYISYLVPAEPEKIRKIEQEISRVELTLANAQALDPSLDRSDADLSLVRLRAQMEPERRREPAVMRSHVGPDGRVFNWDCPRCGSCEGLTHVVASVRNGEVSMLPACPECGAEVIKEELPMPLDLFRMRTRRADGVEMQAKPPTDKQKIDDYVALCHEQTANAARNAARSLDAYLSGQADIPELRQYRTVGQINCEVSKSHCFHMMKRWAGVCCHCGTVRDPFELGVPSSGKEHGEYRNMIPIAEWLRDHPQA